MFDPALLDFGTFCDDGMQAYAAEDDVVDGADIDLRFHSVAE
jgi:hypothetical protein